VAGTIRYVNTDLDLTAPHDLGALAAALDADGVFPLHVTHGDDGLWYATFEHQHEHPEPEQSIAAMLCAIESLPTSLRPLWDGCTRRDFNIGYECGDKPWAFNQGLSAALLGRVAAVGASLRVTLYPDGEQTQE
jgi:hypothetical protein